MVWLAILVGICLLLAPAGIALYRHLTALRMDARSALAHIEEQMHRRHELLSRLIHDVHPDETYDLRAASDATKTARHVRDKAAAERAIRHCLAVALHRLEVTEDALIDDLDRTRQKIDFAATYYNDVVHRYNAKLRQGPARLFARFFGHHHHHPFDLEDP